MGLGDLFVDPTSLPDNGYGLCQLTTLLLGYGYVLFVGSNMISDGSELLLLIPSIAGIVGSCVLPVLGAVPDGMIVLFSGIGPDSQAQLDVGVGALAGSTIMLVTIPWLLSVYAGRVDIEDGKPKYSKTGKRAEGAVTGVPNSANVQKGGYIMMLTSLGYVILQGPAQYFQSEGEDLAEVAAGEKNFALVGLVVTLFFFFGYLFYQWKLSLSDETEDKVTEKIHVEMIIKQIETGRITLRGALYYELLQSKSCQQPNPTSYSAVSSGCARSTGGRSMSAKDVWATLPTHAQSLITAIIRYFWRKFQVKNSSPVTTGELGKLFVSMGENVKPELIESIFRQFDKDRDGVVDFKEVCMGTTQYLWDNKNRADLSADYEAVSKTRDPESGGKVYSDLFNGDGEGTEDEEDDEEEMPEDLAGLEPAEQQRRLLQMSCTTMGIGTFLVVIFSDPMTDVLGELAARTGLKPFYVAFVLAPVASNACELVASYSYALKKTPKSISIALQALQGAACMNNTFCLSIFMGLIYFQGLAWEYTAETIAIVVCELGVAIASAQKNQTMFSATLVFCLYPLCLILVYSLEAIGFD